MKTKLTLVLLLISTMTIYGEYFFDEYTDLQKLDTAHAYLMVSEKFAELGDDEQAEKFKEMALLIYPALIQIDAEEVKTL